MRVIQRARRAHCHCARRSFLHEIWFQTDWHADKKITKPHVSRHCGCHFANTNGQTHHACDVFDRREARSGTTRSLARQINVVRLFCVFGIKIPQQITLAAACAK